MGNVGQCNENVSKRAQGKRKKGGSNFQWLRPGISAVANSDRAENCSDIGPGLRGHPPLTAVICQFATGYHTVFSPHSSLSPPCSEISSCFFSPGAVGWFFCRICCIVRCCRHPTTTQSCPQKFAVMLALHRPASKATQLVKVAEF